MKSTPYVCLENQAVLFTSEKKKRNNDQEEKKEEKELVILSCTLWLWCFF